MAGSGDERRVRALVMHAGGTFGMVKEDGCYVVRAGYLRPLIAANGVLNNGGGSGLCRESAGVRVDYDVWEGRIKDSSDATVEDFEEIVRAIEEHYGAYDGFVVIHGTDTMCYAGAALSFMMEGLEKAVVLTGSMVPLGEAGSDGAANLCGALDAVGRGPAGDVYLYFDGKMGRANRSFKKDAGSFDAFDWKCGGDQGPGNGRARGVRFHYGMSRHVSVVKLTPYTDVGLLREVFARSGAVVLESFGSGNVSAGVLGVVRECRDKVVVNVSQCRRGRVSGAYSVGREMCLCGNVVSGEDMTTEGALAKLSFLLCREDMEGIRRGFAENMRGEVTFE